MANVVIALMFQLNFPTLLAAKKITEERLKMTFEARAEKSTNMMSARLLRLMATKQTTLCVAADLSCSDEVLQLANAVGPYICIFKTHADALNDFSEKFAKELQELSKTHNFLIMEDRYRMTQFFSFCFQALLCIIWIYSFVL